MAAAHREAGLPEDLPPRGQTLYSVQDVEEGVQQDLSRQFETALAFADFCTFVTSGRVSGQSAQLVSLAEALYTETLEDLRRSGPRR